MSYLLNSLKLTSVEWSTNEPVKLNFEAFNGTKYTCYDLPKQIEQLTRRPKKVGGGIKKVIFNDPATIVFWNDGSKTVVKCSGEEFDKEKGLLCCLVKYICGNDNSYHRLFKEWIN